MLGSTVGIQYLGHDDAHVLLRHHGLQQRLQHRPVEAHIRVQDQMIGTVAGYALIGEIVRFAKTDVAGHPQIHGVVLPGERGNGFLAGVVGQHQLDPASLLCHALQHLPELWDGIAVGNHGRGQVAGRRGERCCGGERRGSGPANGL
jgi:hypothetical protein